MDHAPFIIATYAGVALLILALIAHVAWDARRVARRLQALEERGIRRRSAATAADDRP
jgi:heme exporter protein CcmD